MLYAIGVELGVGDLKVDDRVDLHGHIILGNDRLRGKVHHLLLQGDHLGHLFQEGELEVDAHAPDGMERAQALHHIGLGLLDHLDVGGQDQNYQYDQHDRHQKGAQGGKWMHGTSSFTLQTARPGRMLA